MKTLPSFLFGWCPARPFPAPHTQSTQAGTAPRWTSWIQVCKDKSKHSEDYTVHSRCHEKSVLLMLPLHVRRPGVPQRIRHAELQAVWERLPVWVDDVHNSSLVQRHLREALWYKTTCKSKEKGSFFHSKPSCDLNKQILLPNLW